MFRNISTRSDPMQCSNVMRHHRNGQHLDHQGDADLFQTVFELIGTVRSVNSKKFQ